MANLKPATQRRYRTSFRHYKAIFGALHIDEINKARIAEFVTERRRGGASNATIRRDIAALSIVLSCAVEWDWVESNPAKAFNKRQLREAPPRTNYPSDIEIARLVGTAAPMAGRIIKLLAETGMRMEEVCSLEWSQVSVPRREVRLTKTKTSAPRIVPLSDEALGTITGTPRHITAPYVFWHHDGARFTQFSGYFRRLAKRAKVVSRCHDLRHRFASVFLQRTNDLAALQRILGHRTIAMTMRYSHLLTDHLHNAVRKFDDAAGTNIGTSTAVSDCPITIELRV